MKMWLNKQLIAFKKNHDWLSVVAFLSILLAAIGPSFIKFTGEVSDSSTQNSQRSGFEGGVNDGERNHEDEWNQKHPSNNHTKVDHIIRIDSFGQDDGSTNNEGRSHAENR